MKCSNTLATTDKGDTSLTSLGRKLPKTRYGCWAGTRKLYRENYVKQSIVCYEKNIFLLK